MSTRMPPEVWPVCTAFPSCGHPMTHETPGAATEYARQNTERFVSDRGYAVCTCHAMPTGSGMPPERFPCDHQVTS